MLGALRSELDGQDNQLQYERDKQTDSGYIVGTPKSNPKTEGFFEIA